LDIAEEEGSGSGWTKPVPEPDSYRERFDGMALALAREVIELHGGTLDVLGGPKGLLGEFVVRLPLRPIHHLHATN
jgi:nitrogen-specific signal transduction histidine kinase